ncbi:aldo-keto reductase [Dendrothele bispora CBS 962.96]|uniref:Aldo-keto reductase n=1 Tax=Dendrothele bispora (strain CBS 962.96) TaxID=1314807 RepID=A0A4S8L4Q9_DENBC|nr:aldo-keto reductase [Dendrothele bispora CBS 962.96]
MASFKLESTITLRDGNQMPVFGFGTYELDGKDAYNTVTWALEAGYRHVDSAEWYENERECGQAILDFCRKHDVPRSSVFYVSKLKNNNGYERVRRAIDKSVKDCGLGYIDLYLIHGPIGGPKARMDSWKAVCDAQKEGKLKSIGISNYGVRHMKEIVESDSGLPIPAVNQIDLHPFQTRNDVVSYCKDHDIVLEAWAPLVRGLRFKHPSITALAQKYGKESAQVLLRYSLQKGYVTIPKASSKERIVSNTKVFDFELEQADIDALDTLDEGLLTDWDPTDCP